MTSLLASQEEPQGTCQEGGGIGTTGEAHQHGKGEVANGFTTEEEDGNNEDIEENANKIVEKVIKKMKYISSGIDLLNKMIFLLIKLSM